MPARRESPESFLRGGRVCVNAVVRAVFEPHILGQGAPHDAKLEFLTRARRRAGGAMKGRSPSVTGYVISHAHSTVRTYKERYPPMEKMRALLADERDHGCSSMRFTRADTSRREGTVHTPRR